MQNHDSPLNRRSALVLPNDCGSNWIEIHTFPRQNELKKGALLSFPFLHLENFPSSPLEAASLSKRPTTKPASRSMIFCQCTISYTRSTTEDDVSARLPKIDTAIIWSPRSSMAVNSPVVASCIHPTYCILMPLNHHRRRLTLTAKLLSGR